MKIEIKNLSKSFKNNTIIKDINMVLEGGKIYGLVGRNGSGKSVFLKIISGLYNPTSGEVIYNGIDIFKEKIIPPSTRALIEKPTFLPELTGMENLRLLASIQHKIDDKEIIDSLKKVNMYNDKDKKYSKYSLGTKQKLGIAQVLMENPDVIILDEPFNGIELATVKTLRNLLLEEKNKGKLIIIATHIKEDIEELVDVLYEFDDGKATRK
ncbi:MAG: ATP-binding cassette domain-containing protein [Bacilli bacterium]|nr:ATP-binding cassette domain-containing protein [Bacilli bacterium]MCI8778251.1 ATP-binding cassette domain-containing protein [Bacilli bacterium]